MCALMTVSMTREREEERVMELIIFWIIVLSLNKNMLSLQRTIEPTHVNCLFDAFLILY